MVDISILIPVYNVERYVERCVESIVNQEFSGSYEIILVDDCSTDNSYSVLLELQAEYINSTIKIVRHSQNQKLSQARLSGFLGARGKYIWNVDSDDWIEKGALQELYNITLKNDVDVVLFNAQYHNGQVGKTMDSSVLESRVYYEEEIASFQPWFISSIWRKLIKRSFVNENYELFQVSINYEEDLIYCIELFSNIKSLYFTPKVYYSYFHNLKSITKQINQLHRFNNSLLVNELQVKILRKYNNGRMSMFKEYATKAYGLYIFRLLFLKLKLKKISKASVYDFKTGYLNIREMLLITDNSYTFYEDDLEFRKLLKKNTRFYGSFKVFKKIIWHLIH